MEGDGDRILKVANTEWLFRLGMVAVSAVESKRQQDPVSKPK